MEWCSESGDIFQQWEINLCIGREIWRVKQLVAQYGHEKLEFAWREWALGLNEENSIVCGMNQMEELSTSVTSFLEVGLIVLIASLNPAIRREKRR